MKVGIRRIIPYAILVLAIFVLGAGLAAGEFQAVLANALTICLSCIGIG